MRKWVLATIGCLSLVVGGRASAATTDGTLITNVACGTFMSASGMGFAISYCCTANVLVSNPCVSLQKTASPTVQSSGGAVNFQLVAINCSASSSAFNIYITDRLPDNMEWGTAAPVIWTGFAPPPIYTPSRSPDNITWTTGVWPLAGQDAPYWFRWQIEFLPPGKSAGLVFQASVL